jgi:hypothetical protein
MAGTTSSSTRRPASSRNVHCAWPGGGAEQARLTTCASCALSTVQHPARRKDALAAGEGPLQPVAGERGAHPGHRAGIDPNGGGHGHIGLDWIAGAGLGGQQDAGATVLQRGGGIAAQQRAQPVPLLGAEDDNMLPGHGGAPLLTTDPPYPIGAESSWQECLDAVLSPQAKNLVGRGQMQHSDEMIHFAQHDTFTLSRY